MAIASTQASVCFATPDLRESAGIFIYSPINDKTPKLCLISPALLGAADIPIIDEYGLRLISAKTNPLSPSSSHEKEQWTGRIRNETELPVWHKNASMPEGTYPSGHASLQAMQAAALD